MGFNWLKVSTIEPRGTIGDIQYKTDIFKEQVLKIKKSEKNPDPWEISFDMHWLKWLKKRKWSGHKSQA